MEFAAYAWVVISAFTHAYWNFVLKCAGGSQVFIGLSKLAEIFLFIIPFVYFVARDEIAILNYWLFYVVGALLVLANYFFLGRAYEHGELSIVYPISRAGALLFLPILAYVFIGEQIDIIGLAAIFLIVAGLFVIQLPSFSLAEIKVIFSKINSFATIQALLAAFTAACYTLWDKHSISYLSPFVYFYAYTAITGITYIVFILLKHPSGSIKNEWKISKFSILQVGFLNTFTYMLVLFSLQTGKASYVIAVRQLSIGFSVFLGWKILQETFPLPKKLGVATLFLGCILISAAR